MGSEFSGASAKVISSDLIGPPQRKIELTGSGIALVMMTTAIIGIATIWFCFIAAEAARQFQIRTALQGAGNEIDGQIVGIRNPMRALKEYVDYTFIADGRTYSGQAIVPLEDFHIIRLNSGLSIRYLPENPAVNHPADWEWSAVHELSAYFVLILLVGFGMISFILPQILFERRMTAEGLATTGAVTKCRVSGRGDQFITLTYEFHTQDGSSVQGRGSSKAEQEIGARIPILYLSQNPKKNIPYPTSTWRIAKR
jgi:hypothetical protein